MTLQGNTFNQFAPGGFSTNLFGQNVQPLSSLSNSLFAGILDEEPGIPFAGALQRSNLPSNQLDFFRGRLNDTFQQYQGLLDQFIRSGLEPTTQFGDFVGNFDFADAFQRIPSQQRQGILNTRNFAPPTTFMR